MLDDATGSAGAAPSASDAGPAPAPRVGSPSPTSPPIDVPAADDLSTGATFAGHALPTDVQPVAVAPSGDAAAELDPWQVAAAVLDPELPLVTIADLGVLRAVDTDEDGRVEVTITPTYSGCPAMEVIRADIEAALHDHGFADVTVRTVLSPPWTTDWISDAGRRTLEANGIAPPAPRQPSTGPVRLELSVRCPRCGSTDTRLVSRFGSTACKALRACNSCLEPFDHVKAI